MSWKRSCAQRVRQHFLPEEKRDWFLEQVASGLDQMIHTRRQFLTEADPHRQAILLQTTLQDKRRQPGPDWEW